MINTPQARPQGEDDWYSPARDITHLTPALIRSALCQWEVIDGEFRRYADRAMVTEEDICAVALALAEFCSEDTLLADGVGLEQAFEKCGFDAIAPKARLIVFGLLGQELLGAFWYSIRTSATAQKKEEIRITQFDKSVLVKAGARLIEVFRAPRWRRRWKIRWMRAKNWLLEKLNGSTD